MKHPFCFQTACMPTGTFAINAKGAEHVATRQRFDSTHGATLLLRFYSPALGFFRLVLAFSRTTALLCDGEAQLVPVPCMFVLDFGPQMQEQVGQRTNPSSSGRLNPRPALLGPATGGLGWAWQLAGLGCCSFGFFVFILVCLCFSFVLSQPGAVWETLCCSAYLDEVCVLCNALLFL